VAVLLRHWHYLQRLLLLQQLTPHQTHWQQSQLSPHAQRAAARVVAEYHQQMVPPAAQLAAR
jgi:hypothetical protein